MNAPKTKPNPGARHEPDTDPDVAQAESAQASPSAQGKKLPHASRLPQGAPPEDLQTTAEAAMNIPDPDTDPRAFWAAIAGVAPDQLIFPPAPGALQRRWIRWRTQHPRIEAGLARALRLWRIVWFGPHHPDPAPMPAIPINLAPWTNQPLAHHYDAGDAPARIRDRLLWSLSHPVTRYETHAWRCAARTDTALSLRIKTMRCTLAGKPQGGASQ